MDWIEEVKQKQKRKNTILLSKNSPVLHRLKMRLSECNRRAVVLWALELANEAATALKKRNTNGILAEKAVAAARMWAAGQVKMPFARREILDCHKAAKAADSAEDAALFHAVGQAAGTVHTVGHALGFPIYELTSLVYKYGVDACGPHVEKRCREYLDILNSKAKEADNPDFKWAEFMLK